ncbi:MAG: flagellar hook-basal body complex protein [Bacillota bacterium]|nr:flagellar hook-basal body complex protein [Bacillota bacterium]
MRDLYSGISGMQANQTKLDVIGNNIANSQTTAFKSSRVRFEDMLSQTVNNAGAPTVNQGGTNAAQIGLGTQVAGIDTVTKQGNMQPTSRSLDVAIDGDGYFVVGKGPSVFQDNTININQQAGTHNADTTSLTKSGVALSYGRDGAFTLDSEGNLLNSDGYRIMGYSLSNDDTSMAPTEKEPQVVNLRGFKVQFGPGSQLNGYKVILGTVGAGTVASASVDKANKVITLNGDFASDNGISSDAAQKAINNALSQAGIGQTAIVNGTATQITGITSNDKISGGTDDTAPGDVSLAGFNFSFGKGNVLNGYSIKLGDISPGQSPALSATVDTTNNVITINGDFDDANMVTADALQKVINNATNLPAGAQITVTGSPISFLPSDTISGGKDAVAPSPSTYVVGGLTITPGKTSVINNYSVDVKNDTSLPMNTSSISASNGKITISYNGNPADIQTNFNNYFGLTGAQAATITGTPANGTNSQVFSGGADQSNKASVNYKGMNFSFTFPNTATTFESLNNYTIVYGDITNGTGSATVDSTKRIIKISGDFTNPGAIDKNQIATDIQNGLNAAGITLQSVSVTGTPAMISNANSDTVAGGTTAASPGGFDVAGYHFSFATGTELNGYTVQLGTVAAGTPTSATVDEASKRIIINGDFVTPGVVVDPAQIKSKINTALAAKGINQTVNASQNSPLTINNTASELVAGGTPVQSVDNDGVINFVDGTKTMNSFDTSLKSLRIPDKVHDATTGKDLRVTNFTISKDGIITATLEDGRVAALGQISMATFKNPAGLTKTGKNMYDMSVNSGDATFRSGIGTLGEDNSKGYGDMSQGMLEMSNVDLAEQFTDMIVASRAFQANSKTITTGDEILQDIINLKR